MSLSAKLELGDNTLGLYNSEYAVVECRYEMAKVFNRGAMAIETQTDVAKIVLTVIAPNGSDFTLYNWYVAMIMQSGRIVLDLSSILASYDNKNCKTISFENAHCVGISECYNIDSFSRRELTITLLANRLEVDNVDLNVKISR